MTPDTSSSQSAGFHSTSASLNRLDVAAPDCSFWWRQRMMLPLADDGSISGSRTEQAAPSDVNLRRDGSPNQSSAASARVRTPRHLYFIKLESRLPWFVSLQFEQKFRKSPADDQAVTTATVGI